MKKNKMAKHGCHKIDLDDTKYSSPVPAIGLYIAGATLVCFLFMLYYIISGFRRKKNWLPCRLFSLNSVTLTLIAIAAKIPVDLTTSMPSALDQFSKLTGTTIICTSMAVLLPSLGSTQSSDSLTNMASLSIFVVTVVVNICIQIRTRVIVLFIPEHIIIMCCMLLLLILLWDSALAIKSNKDIALDRHKDLLTKSSDSLFWRVKLATKSSDSLLRQLKLAYILGYNTNSQFLLCKYLSHSLVATLSVLCLVVIIQAASRFLSLEFCRGFSQYDWSIWIIVMTQIVTITLGAFAINFRRLALFLGKDEVEKTHFMNDRMHSNPLLRQDLRDRCKHHAVDQPIFVVKILLAIVLHLVGYLVQILLEYFYLDKYVREYFKHAEVKEYDFKFGAIYDEWSFVKSVDDMKRCMEGISKSASLNHMFQLLLKTPPSTRTLEHTMEIKNERHPGWEGIEVTSLSIVVLVRIAQVSIPSKLSGFLVEAYRESHEIIHFIFDSINSVTMENRKMSQVAQAAWRGDDFSRLLLPKFFEKYTSSSGTNPLALLSEFDRARAIINELTNMLRGTAGDLFHDADMITYNINGHEYSSIEDLYNYIELLFVDMMHMVIAQLPLAIFKYVTESPAEEIEERVKLGLKFLCQVEPLETHIRWRYPAQGNFSSLITSDIRTDSRDHQEVTGDGNVSSLFKLTSHREEFTGDGGEISLCAGEISLCADNVQIDSSDRQEVTGHGDSGEISICVE